MKQLLPFIFALLLAGCASAPVKAPLPPAPSAPQSQAIQPVTVQVPQVMTLLYCTNGPMSVQITTTGAMAFFIIDRSNRTNQ